MLRRHEKKRSNIVRKTVKTNTRKKSPRRFVAGIFNFLYTSEKTCLRRSNKSDSRISRGLFQRAYP